MRATNNVNLVTHLVCTYKYNKIEIHSTKAVQKGVGGFTIHGMPAQMDACKVKRKRLVLVETNRFLCFNYDSPDFVVISRYSFVLRGNLSANGTRELPIFIKPFPTSTFVMCLDWGIRGLPLTSEFGRPNSVLAATQDIRLASP